MHFNTPLVNEAPKNTDEGEDYETHNAIHVQNIFNTCPLEYLGIFLHSPRLRLEEHPNLKKMSQKLEKVKHFLYPLQIILISLVSWENLQKNSLKYKAFN